MINIQDLSFGYTRKQCLFKEFCLNVEKGSIVGLLGKNGAGKSTLLKLIAGLLQSHSGSLSVLGYKPFQRKPSFLQQVYMVPEEFYTPSIGIRSYVKASAPLYPSFDYSKMERISKDFELDMSKNLDKMSYGQKKKFLIAFALSTNCELLVFDEPTNGLDIPSKTLFRKIMAGSLSEDQLAIISTHQVKDVETLIDRIVLIEQGQVMFNCNIFDICQNFAFYTVSDLSKVDYLYQEKAPGGYNVIMNKNGTETPLDIELLFNAIINGIKLTIHESNI
jgi:ABC-2 type transport system ATP-binding protein